MLDWVRGSLWRPFLVGLCLLILGWFVAVGIGLRPYECPAEQGESEQEPCSESFASRASFPLYWFNHFAEEHEGAFVGLGTIALAFFTLFLWRSTDALARAAKAQGESNATAALAAETSADRATETFKITQRPHLRVREISMSDFGGGQLPDIRLIVVNQGNTRAAIIRSEFMVRTYENFPARSPTAEEGRSFHEMTVRDLTGGMATEVKFKGQAAIQPAEVANIKTGNLGLFVVGILTYRDELGIGHHTGFCRKYDPTRDRFRVFPDEDHEYQM